MARYVPPVQSKAGQIIDVVVLLVMTIGALYLSLWLRLAGSDHSGAVPENPTWESLGQNEVMVERWIELGYAEPADAAEMITARFDYSFTLGSLLAMIVVVIGYYAIVLRLSEKEYRDVVSEKFDR
jgi:hypothetical protein